MKMLELQQPSLKTYTSTVEPRSTDTPLIRTPRYYGQFGIPRPKAHTFL